MENKTIEKSKISVIVPVYNVERFLCRCVDSILAQTYTELEILLIDDGSTDASGKIADEYAGKDPRIKVIHQENKGLSGARNTGIENATANHFIFIDSDDEIMPTMAEELMSVMIKTDADIVQCDFFEVKIEDGDDENLLRSHIGDVPLKIDTEIKIFTDDEKIKQLLYEEILTVVQWNKLFRRKIFDNIRYPEGKYHEDEFVAHKEVFYANKMAFIDRKLYIYYRHKGAITASFNFLKIYHILQALTGRVEFLEEQGKYRFATELAVYFMAHYAEFCIKFDKSNDEIWEDKCKPLAKQMKEKINYYTRNEPISYRIKWKFDYYRYRLYLLKEKILHGKK